MLSRRLPLVVAAVSLVVALLVLFLFVMPKRSQVAAEREKLDSAVQRQAELELELQRLIELKQQAQETRRLLDKIDVQIPKTADQPGLIRLMQLATDKAVVDLSAQTYGAPASAGNYSSIGVSLSVEGNFFQLDQFLYQLETLPRLMKVSSIAIAPGTYPLLSLTVTAETFTSDTSAGPGGKPGHQGESETTTETTTTTTTETTTETAT